MGRGMRKLEMLYVSSWLAARWVYTYVEIHHVHTPALCTILNLYLNN